MYKRLNKNEANLLNRLYLQLEIIRICAVILRVQKNDRNTFISK
jgi:hypothetical protein